MYYYSCKGKTLASTFPIETLDSTASFDGSGHIYAAVSGDPMVGRASFRVSHPGQLVFSDSLDQLDASRLPNIELDEIMSAAISDGRVTAVNINRTNWQDIVAKEHDKTKKRVNILAIGDVGSTLLTGLKLLGGDVISSIGICDLSEQITSRWEFEMGQIALPWNYDAMPEVEVVTPDNLFECDVFIFVASKGIPPVGSKIKDVRMAQFEANSAIVKHYAQMARKANFKGLWCAVSDPVDPLAKTAYLESNKDENGNWDGKGLSPEQVQGFGLGVMNARAAYFSKRDDRFKSFLTEGRCFGPHGTGLITANSIDNYDDQLSLELTQLTVTANLKMREIGFKPYVAPALSSGALSILLTMRGEWHYGSVLLDGIYMGVKNRYTRFGIETEMLASIPEQLFSHIKYAAEHLKEII